MVRCPDCGSAKTKKSSAVYEQGSSRSSGAGGGISLSSSGRIGAFSHKFSSQRITGIAERNSRPFLDGGGLLIGLLAFPMLVGVLIVAGAGFGAVIFVILAGLIGLPILGVLTAIKPSDAQKVADAKYDRQWYCYQCGGTFERIDI